MRLIKVYAYCFLLVKRLYKKQHLKINNSDIKCPNCNEWFSISGIEYQHTYRNNNKTDLCTCGQCGHVSEWLCMAGLFVLVNVKK